MGKSLNTLLLAVGALIMVGAGAFIIATTALSDDVSSSPAASGPDEQHVYLTNLGMT